MPLWYTSLTSGKRQIDNIDCDIIIITIHDTSFFFFFKENEETSVEQATQFSQQFGLIFTPNMAKPKSNA